MKKIIVTLLAVVMVFSLVACGAPAPAQETPAADATNSTSSDNAAANGDAATQDFAGKVLNVGIWGGNDQETASIEKMKTDFEAKTGAKVNFKVYTDYNTQIQADLIAKTAPDVFYIDANMFPFISSLGVLEPLNKEEMQVSSFYENLIASFTGQDGEVYAMPKDFSTLALYINTDMIADVGLTVEDVPKTWEEFVTFLPEFQAKLDEKYGKNQVTAMTYNLELARNLHLLERGGAKAIDDAGMSTLDTEGIIKNFQLIMDLTGTGAYKEPKDLGLGWNGEAMGAKKTAIMDEGNWVYNTLLKDFSDVNFTVVDMPTYLGEKSSMLFSVGYGIYANSKEKDLAKEWIKYATGTEGMATWCSGTGTLPSRKDVADALKLESDPNLAVHLAQVDYSIPWQLGQYSSIIGDQYKNFAPEAVAGKMPVKDALAEADKQSNQQIEAQ